MRTSDVFSLLPQTLGEYFRKADLDFGLSFLCIETIFQHFFDIKPLSFSIVLCFRKGKFLSKCISYFFVAIRQF